MKPRRLLAPGAYLLVLAGLLAMGGCFQTPTAPDLFTSLTGGGTQQGVFPSPGATPVTGGGTGGGTITGTVSNSSGGTIYISASEINTNALYYTTRAGDGPYTLSGVADGTYVVAASDPNGLQGTDYPGDVVIANGSTASGIDLSF